MEDTNVDMRNVRNVNRCAKWSQLTPMQFWFLLENIYVLESVSDEPIVK